MRSTPFAKRRSSTSSGPTGGSRRCSCRSPISTRAFGARFAARMGGKMPTEDQAAAYSATLSYLRAVKAAGTIEGDRVVAEMKKSPIDAPLFGRVVVRADGRASQAMYVFRVKAPATIAADRVVPEMTTSPLDDPLFGRVVVRADGRATHPLYVFTVQPP